MHTIKARISRSKCSLELVLHLRLYTSRCRVLRKPASQPSVKMIHGGQAHHHLPVIRTMGHVACLEMHEVGKHEEKVVHLVVAVQPHEQALREGRLRESPPGVPPRLEIHTFHSE